MGQIKKLKRGVFVVSDVGMMMKMEWCYGSSKVPSC